MRPRIALHTHLHQGGASLRMRCLGGPVLQLGSHVLPVLGSFRGVTPRCQQALCCRRRGHGCGRGRRRWVYGRCHI